MARAYLGKTMAAKRIYRGGPAGEGSTAFGPLKKPAKSANAATKALYAASKTLESSFERRAKVEQHPVFKAAKAKYVATQNAETEIRKTTDIKAARTAREASTKAAIELAQTRKSVEADMAKEVRKPRAAKAKAQTDQSMDAPDVGGSKKAKSVTPRRAAAVENYKKAFGSEPKSSMAIGTMERKVRQNEVSASNARQNAAHVKKYFGVDHIGAGADHRGSMDTSKLSTTRQPAPVYAERTPYSPPVYAEPKAPLGERISNVAGKINKFGTPASIAIQAANTYNRARDPEIGNKSRRDAVIEAAKASAPGAAVIAAPVIAKGAGHVASGAFGVAGALADFASDNLFAEWFLSFPAMKLAGISGAVGVAAKGVEIAAKAASKFALPVVAGYSAYQGAKEDVSPTRGALRGVVRALDPTGIVMSKGYGERAFDAVAGDAAAPVRQANGTGGSRSARPAKAIEVAKAGLTGAVETAKATGIGPQQAVSVAKPADAKKDTKLERTVYAPTGKEHTRAEIARYKNAA